MSIETVAWKMGFSSDQALALENACLSNGIDTEQRVCHFLAQVAHESGCGRWMEELASGEAYEGRKDLGNLESGDGKRFKGRGLIQITGRDNYEEYSWDAYGDDRMVNYPKRMGKLPDAAASAGWYWKDRGLNWWADKDDLEGVTRKINGGLNGLADRRKWLDRARQEYDRLRGE